MATVQPPSPKRSTPREAAVATATKEPSPSPTPLRTIALPPPRAATPSPGAVSVASGGANSAAALVRSYLEALAQGNRATATSYLAHGTPNETFMNPDARIESVRSTSVGLAQYQVTADILTASGEYYVTCTVEQGPSGLQITDHYWIKPQ